MSILMILATTMFLAAGEPPPANRFQVVCTGTEIRLGGKPAEVPWSQTLSLNVQAKTFCLEPCTTWSPMVGLEYEGARLSDGPQENSFFGWKKGHMHYEWMNLRREPRESAIARSGKCSLITKAAG